VFGSTIRNGCSAGEAAAGAESPSSPERCSMGRPGQEARGR
jgi:hypothetical protein